MANVEKLIESYQKLLEDDDRIMAGIYEVNKADEGNIDYCFDFTDGKDHHFSIALEDDGYFSMKHEGRQLGRFFPSLKFARNGLTVRCDAMEILNLLRPLEKEGVDVFRASDNAFEAEKKTVAEIENALTEKDYSEMTEAQTSHDIYNVLRASIDRTGVNNSALAKFIDECRKAHKDINVPLAVLAEQSSRYAAAITHAGGLPKRNYVDVRDKTGIGYYSAIKNVDGVRDKIDRAYMTMGIINDAERTLNRHDMNKLMWRSLQGLPAGSFKARYMLKGRDELKEPMDGSDYFDIGNPFLEMEMNVEEAALMECRKNGTPNRHRISEAIRESTKGYEDFVRGDMLTSLLCDMRNECGSRYSFPEERNVKAEDMYALVLDVCEKDFRKDLETSPDYYILKGDYRGAEKHLDVLDFEIFSQKKDVCLGKEKEEITKDER